MVSRWKRWRAKHRSFWAKVWKSLVAVGLTFTLVSPLDVSISWTAFGVLGAIVFVLVLYWHSWDLYDDVKSFFSDMSRDITFIRKQVEDSDDEDDD